MNLETLFIEAYAADPHTPRGYANKGHQENRLYYQNCPYVPNHDPCDSRSFSDTTILLSTILPGRKFSATSSTAGYHRNEGRRLAVLLPNRSTTIYVCKFDIQSACSCSSHYSTVPFWFPSSPPLPDCPSGDLYSASALVFTSPF